MMIVGVLKMTHMDWNLDHGSILKPAFDEKAMSICGNKDSSVKLPFYFFSFILFACCAGVSFVVPFVLNLFALSRKNL